jgi:hypothetical protein
MIVIVESLQDTYQHWQASTSGAGGAKCQGCPDETRAHGCRESVDANGMGGVGGVGAKTGDAGRVGDAGGGGGVYSEGSRFEWWYGGCVNV